MVEDTCGDAQLERTDGGGGGRGGSVHAQLERTDGGCGGGGGRRAVGAVVVGRW